MAYQERASRPHQSHGQHCAVLGLVAPKPDENGGGGDDGAAVAAPGRLKSVAAGCVLHGWGMGWLIALEVSHDARKRGSLGAARLSEPLSLRVSP